MTMLDPVLHAQLGWRKGAGFAFARRLSVQAIAQDEIPRAAQSMPVALRRGDGRWHAVVVLGPIAGTNVFVAKDGRWRAPYVPAALRVYPFRLAEDSSALAIAEGYRMEPLGPAEVQLFFRDGALTEELERIRAFLMALREGVVATHNTVTLLERLGAVRPWAVPHLTVTDPALLHSDLFRIDPVALEALSDADWLRLRRLRSIGWVHAHLESLSHADWFRARAKDLVDELRRPAARTDEPGRMAMFLDALSMDISDGP